MLYQKLMIERKIILFAKYFKRLLYLLEFLRIMRHKYKKIVILGKECFALFKKNLRYLSTNIISS